MQIRPYTHTNIHTLVHTRSRKNWGHLYKLPKILTFTWAYAVACHFFFCFSRARDTLKGKKAPNVHKEKLQPSLSPSTSQPIGWTALWKCNRFAVHLRATFTFFSFPFLLRVHTDKHAYRESHISTQTHRHSRARRCIGIYKKRQKLLALAACLGRQAAAATENGQPQLPLQCLLLTSLRLRLQKAVVPSLSALCGCSAAHHHISSV